MLVPETDYADAEFGRHRVTGFGGCNQYGALYRTGTRSLLVSQPASTLLACDEESMAFDRPTSPTSRRAAFTPSGARR